MASRIAIRRLWAMCVLVAVMFAQQHTTPAAGEGHNRRLVQVAAMPALSDANRSSTVQPLTAKQNSTEAATRSREAQNASSSAAPLAAPTVGQNETVDLASGNGTTGGPGNAPGEAGVDYSNVASLPTSDNTAHLEISEKAILFAKCKDGQIAIASQCATVNEAMRSYLGITNASASVARSPGGAQQVSNASGLKVEQASGTVLQWAVPLVILQFVLAAAPFHIMW